MYFERSETLPYSRSTSSGDPVECSTDTSRMTARFFRDILRTDLASVGHQDFERIPGRRGGTIGDVLDDDRLLAVLDSGKIHIGNLAVRGSPPYTREQITWMILSA